MAYDGGYENEPRKLELLRTSPSVLSTELVGAVEEDGVWSYAYRFTTNRGSFIAARWMALYADTLNPPEEWLAKNDASKWVPGNRDFDKAFAAMQKEELLRVRKDLLKDTLEYFREQAKGDAKEGLKNLLLEGYDGDSDWNQVAKDFPKSKVHEKIWKSVKLT